MNIGLFTDAYLPDINGVVSSVATLKDALEKQGHTVYVISNHKGTNIEMKDHILRLGGLELKKFYGYKMSSPIQIGAEKYIRSDRSRCRDLWPSDGQTASYPVSVYVSYDV